MWSGTFLHHWPLRTAVQIRDVASETKTPLKMFCCEMQCVMCSHSHLAVCGGGSLHCMWMALSSCRGLWWVGGRLALGRGVFLFPLRPQQVPVELAWLDTEGLRDGKVCSAVSMQFCSYICSSTNSWAWSGGQTRGGFEWMGRDWCGGKEQSVVSVLVFTNKYMKRDMQCSIQTATYTLLVQN